MFRSHFINKIIITLFTIKMKEKFQFHSHTPNSLTRVPLIRNLSNFKENMLSSTSANYNILNMKIVDVEKLKGKLFKIK